MPRSGALPAVPAANHVAPSQLRSTVPSDPTVTHRPSAHAVADRSASVRASTSTWLHDVPPSVLLCTAAPGPTAIHVPAPCPTPSRVAPVLPPRLQETPSTLV